jgi:hypothetical protein
MQKIIINMNSIKQKATTSILMVAESDVLK